jgi:hypothetical protein
VETTPNKILSLHVVDLADLGGLPCITVSGAETHYSWAEGLYSRTTIHSTVLEVLRAVTTDFNFFSTTLRCASKTPKYKISR